MHEGSTGRTILRYIALGALFLVPLTPLVVLNSFFFPFITGKAFYFRIIIEIGFAAYLVLAAIDKEYRPRFSWIGVIVTAFVLWMFVADIFAINTVKAFWSNFERMEGWILLIHLWAFFIAASAVMRVEKKWRVWFMTSIAVSVVIVIHSLLQLAGSLPIHQGANRIDASFGNSAYLAIYLLFSTFVALWLALTEKEAWLKWSLIVLATVEAVLIFYTETRGTIVGLGVGALLAIFLTAFFSGARARRYAIGAFVALLVLFGGFFLIRNTAFVHDTPVLDRIASIRAQDLSVRFTIWHMAYQGFLDRPITGYGQEGFNYVFNKYYNPSLYQQEPWFDRAHNAFIDWLMAGGAPAFILYILLFASAIYFLWRTSSLTIAERTLLSAALVGYALHNMVVFDNLYSYVYFFAILALLDSQLARPIPAFERVRVSETTAITLVLPVTAVVGLLFLWFVNVPQINTATGLIYAISPQLGTDQNFAEFKSLVAINAPEMQEVREQLVSFANNASADTSLANDTKAQIASFTLGQLNIQNTLHPGDARSELELSLAYRAAGDLQGSLKALKNAETLSPGKEQIYLEEGATDIDIHDFSAAKAAFDKAYSLGPQFTQLVPFVAAGDYLVGDTASARAILEKNFGTTVVDSDALALAYYQTKDYADLIALWQLRNSGDSASINTAFGLTAAYYLAGDRAHAISTLQAALAKYPESADQISAALKALESGQAI